MPGRRDLIPILVCAILVMLAAAQLLTPWRDRSAVPARAGFAMAAGPPAVMIAVPPTPSFPAILRQPLFSPDRHAADAGLSSPGGGASLAAYAALGAAVGGKTATGVISGPTGAVKILRLGEAVEGWRLVTVEKGRLTFEKGGARHALVVGAPAEAVAQAARPETVSTPSAEP